MKNNLLLLLLLHLSILFVTQGSPANLIGGIAGGVRGAVGGVRDTATDAKDTLKEGAGGVAGTVKNKTVDAAGTIKNGTVSAAGTVKNGTVDAAGTIKNGTVDAAGTIKNGTVHAADTIKNGTADAAGSIKNSTAVKIVSNTVTDTLDDTVLEWTEDGLRAVNIDDVKLKETIGFSASDDVYFFLYTQNNPTNGSILDLNDTETFIYFNPEHDTKIVTHGWMSSAKKMDKMREEFIKSGKDLNIIMVDWEKGSTNVLYNLAKYYVFETGERLARLIDDLVERGLDPEKLHLIGHSLGAHISGVAANRSSVTIHRITGLDPAAPLFGGQPAENRLDPSDAKSVQIIHTCAGLLGWESPMGHVDFYPNGGTKSQPGCGLDTGGSCSHSRSHQYYAESINTPTGFVAKACSDWETFINGDCNTNATLLMGEQTPLSARGVYYLLTSESEPYALY